MAAEAPAWLVALLLLFLALAAVEDGWRLRISNLLVLGVAATGLTAMIVTRIGQDAWQPVLLALIILAIGTPLFAAGWLGGGDVKLLAACGLWFTFDGGWKMLVAVAIAGGILALLAIIIRFFRIPDSLRERVGLLRRGVGVPYGIAVATGVAAMVVTARA